MQLLSCHFVASFKDLTSENFAQDHPWILSHFEYFSPFNSPFSGHHFNLRFILELEVAVGHFCISILATRNRLPRPHPRHCHCHPERFMHRLLSLNAHYLMLLFCGCCSANYFQSNSQRVLPFDFSYPLPAPQSVPPPPQHKKVFHLRVGSGKVGVAFPLTGVSP